MKLEVLICTFDERIKQISHIFLSQRPDVSYLVSFQYSNDKMLELLKDFTFNRPDIKLITIKGHGLSANRNHALKNSTGDIILIADDDVRYENSYFDNILHQFQSDTKLDIACFQANDMEGKPLRTYPDFSFSYEKSPHGVHYILSVAIAMRHVHNLPEFDERFGIGAPYLGAGEEEIFLWEASHAGLHIRYIPEVIVKTERRTTGSTFFTNKAVQRSKGAVLCKMHGPVKAWLRCLKYAVMHCRGHHFLRILLEMTRGILYAGRK